MMEMPGTIRLRNQRGRVSRAAPGSRSGGLARPSKKGGNGGLTGDDGNARDYSVEKPAQTRHNGTLGRLKVRALRQVGWLAEHRSCDPDLWGLIRNSFSTSCPICCRERP